MLKNYIKIALRNLRKHPGYTFINVSGLAVGLACSLLILIYVRDEVSYDRFWSHPDRIYRVLMDGKISDRELHAPITPAPMAPTIANEFPEIEASARVFTLSGQTLVARDTRQFLEKRFFYADSSFFRVFGYPMLAGDPRTALKEPHTVVLTQSTAKKYFPEGNALGKMLAISDTIDYRVTGIIPDVPSNAHMHFDFLASMTDYGPAQDQEWVSNNFSTYVLLRPGHKPAETDAKFRPLMKKYAEPQLRQFMNIGWDEFIKAGNRLDYELQPITDIHLKSHLEFETEPNGSMMYVYIFSAIGFFILLIACINFMNLATARSAGRAREVGMRKVLGSTRQQIIRQFLAESAVMSLAALLLAVILVLALVPVFNNLSGKTVGFGSLFTPVTLLVLLGLTLAVALLAGSYPAFFLSSFQPVSVLKGKFDSSRKGVVLRSGLVVFQFAISITLIVSTLVVYNQLNYVRHKSLGFDKEQVLVVKRAGVLDKQFDAFKSALRGNTGIVNVGGATSLPGGLFGQTAYRPEGARSDQTYVMSPMFADYDWAETMGLQMAAGRDFSRDFPTDTAAFVINEAAARVLGWKEPVGKNLERLGDDTNGKIIGVVRDFNFASLHDEIGPLVIQLSKGALPYVTVRVKPGDVAGTIAFVQKQWETFAPGQPFDYSFLDADFDALYKKDQQLGQIFTVFAVLAIVIACLGLFGLASFTTQQRTKEIGVRKSLGASVPGIVVLLSKEFTKLVAIAFVVAAPIAWFAMHRWLQDFAYRTNIGILTFVAAAIIALLIAWLTVSYQSIKAATINPVQALRYE